MKIFHASGKSLQAAIYGIPDGAARGRLSSIEHYCLRADEMIIVEGNYRRNGAFFEEIRRDGRENVMGVHYVNVMFLYRSCNDPCRTSVTDPFQGVLVVTGENDVIFRKDLFGLLFLFGGHKIDVVTQATECISEILDVGFSAADAGAVLVYE